MAYFHDIMLHILYLTVHPRFSGKPTFDAQAPEFSVSMKYCHRVGTVCSPSSTWSFAPVDCSHHGLYYFSLFHLRFRSIFHNPWCCDWGGGCHIWVVFWRRAFRSWGVRECWDHQETNNELCWWFGNRRFWEKHYIVRWKPRAQYHYEQPEWPKLMHGFWDPGSGNNRHLLGRRKLGKKICRWICSSHRGTDLGGYHIWVEPAQCKRYTHTDGGSICELQSWWSMQYIMLSGYELVQCAITFMPECFLLLE